MKYYQIKYADQYRNESAIIVEIIYHGNPFAFIIDFKKITRKEVMALKDIAKMIIGRKISASIKDLEDIRKEPASYPGFIYPDIRTFLKELKLY